MNDVFTIINIMIRNGIENIFFFSKLSIEYLKMYVLLFLLLNISYFINTRA